jgi:hypothetical protein
MLREIGLKYGTDKATFHNFCDIYENEFLNIRNNNIRFLEIGIGDTYTAGSSLKMWEEYFENGEIIGTDILSHSDKNTERIKTLILNQEIESDLLSIPGLFDIILDDGGHTMLQQQLTFSTLIDKLKDDGIYIIEDLHTSKRTDTERWGATEENNTLKMLNDLKNGKLTSEKYFISSDKFNYLLKIIKSIDIHITDTGSITSIIKKKIVSDI